MVPFLGALVWGTGESVEEATVPGLGLQMAGSCTVLFPFKRSDRKKLWCPKQVAKIKLKAGNWR